MTLKYVSDGAFDPTSEAIESYWCSSSGKEARCHPHTTQQVNGFLGVF